MSSEKKKNGKFITTILIGGALGSVAALLFRRKPSTQEPSQGFFGKWFGKKE